MFRFSICTAFFNDEINNVEKLYSSIKEQHVDWEWVVTDDFSEDESVKYHLINLSNIDSRVRYVNQSHKMEFMRNPSPFAQGEFIFHIDSDDLVYPGYLPICEKLFDRFPEVGIILTGGNFVTQHGDFRSYQVHKESSVCFLGRCWRRAIEINLSEMVEDNFFTFCNDLFIVRYLSLKSKLLVVPRIFIKYREFVNEIGEYKPFGDRIESSENLSNAHKISFNQFVSNYDNQKQPYDGVFPFYDGIDKITPALYPVHSFSIKKIRFVGFSMEWWQMYLIQDLYYDMEISFGDDLKEDSINIIDTSLIREVGSEFKIIAYFSEQSNDLVNFYRENIIPHYYMTYDGQLWIIRY
jgi:hypothetical protein